MITLGDTSFWFVYHPGMVKMLDILASPLETVAQLIPWAGFDKAIWSIPALADAANPLHLLALFLASSLVMIWRLNVIETKGVEGTVIGTLGRLPRAAGALLAGSYVLFIVNGVFR